MSFLAPAFLAGLALLALPWWLHRFSDEEPSVRAFPSERFLEAVPPPVSRTRRLRHKALLALRLLALVALCTLFAGPLFDRFVGTGAGERLHVYAVDTSWSMRAGTRFEDALEALRARLGELPPDAAAGLVAFGDGATELGADDATAADVLGALDDLEPGHGRADYGTLMRRLDAIAAASELPMTATVFTDAQASGMPARSGDLLAPRVDALSIVRVDDPSAPPNARLSAEAVSLDGATARVVVRASGSAGTAVDDPALTRRVTVTARDETLAAIDVAVPAGGTVERTLESVALPPSRDTVLTASFDTDADALPEDDAQTVPVREVRPVDVVLAGLGTRVPPAAATFLATALETDERARVEVREGASDAVVPEGAAHAVLFVAEGDGSGLDAAALVAERGTDALVVTVPAPSSVRSGGASGVAPGTASVGAASGSASGAGAGDTSGTGVGRVDDAHPLALGEIDWYDVRWFDPTEVAPADGDAVLLETASGTPLLVERPVAGESRLLLLADPLDGEASDLPFAPAFVDLVGRTLDWFGASGALPERVRVGESVPLPANVQVLDPDGEPLLGLGDTAVASGFVPRRPGLYRVVDPRGERALVVEIDPRESDTAAMSPAAFDGWARAGGGPDGDAPAGVGDAGDADAATASGDGSADANDAAGASARDDGASSARAFGAVTEAARDEARRWQWQLLLPLVALLLLGETLLANRRLNVTRDGS